MALVHANYSLLAAAFVSVNSVTKINQTSVLKMVQLNTAVEIRLFSALICDLHTMKSNKIKYTKQTKN